MTTKMALDPKIAELDICLKIKIWLISNLDTFSATFSFVKNLENIFRSGEPMLVLEENFGSQIFLKAKCVSGDSEQLNFCFGFFF